MGRGLDQRLGAVAPGALLARDDLAVGTFTDVARALSAERGYLVPGAVAERLGAAPSVPRLALLRAPFWTREERLWQLFMMFGARRR